MEEQIPAAPTISFSDIVVNVFASPAEAYEGIRTSPTRATVWLIPLLVTFVLTIGTIWMSFTNETIRSQIAEQQRERMQEQVQAGKMTQDRADQMIDGMEKGSGMMIAFGIVGAVIFITIVLFIGALFLWLIGKLALKADAGYGKYLELWGSSMWIGILGLIVSALLVMAFNSMYASPSAALAVLSSYSPKNSLHRLLTSLNVFTLWQIVVVGIGLSKFSGKSMGVGVSASFILWLGWTLISVFALASMFGG
jgi:hypothetical protein